MGRKPSKVPTKGGCGESKSSRLRYRKRLLQMANWAFGGSWKFSEVSEGKIVLVDTALKMDHSKIHANALEMCKLRRYAHMSGGQTRDMALGRTVPWSCVSAAWEWLKGPPAEKPESYSANGYPCAKVNLRSKITHLLACMENGWIQPAWSGIIV